MSTTATQTQTEVKYKTYVLLPNMDVTAPVYKRISKEQRVRIDKLPEFCPFLRITFQDSKGKNVTIRYKETANTIYQSEQIKDGIPANDPWTSNERRAMVFTNGVLVTKNKMAQDYLDAYPANELFQGFCPDIPIPVYKIQNKMDELITSNEDFKLRTKAAMKIVGLNLKQAQEMILRLNGSFVEVPKAEDGVSPSEALILCQDMLVAFLDAAEEGGLNAILEEEESAEDTIKVMIGKLVNAKVISFDQEEGKQVSKKSKGQWVKLMDMPSDLPPEEKERLLIVFLNSEEGKVHLMDLQNEEKKIDKR